MFLAGENRYVADFSQIPGSPAAYWVSKAMGAPYNNHGISSGIRWCEVRAGYLIQRKMNRSFLARALSPG